MLCNCFDECISDIYYMFRKEGNPENVLVAVVIDNYSSDESLSYLNVLFHGNTFYSDCVRPMYL